MPTTFQVDKVSKKTTPLNASSVEAIVQQCIGGVKPEAFSRPPTGGTPVDAGSGFIRNGFVAAVHTAYDGHYPLIITPDAIWLCIIQGLAQHINANPKELRHLFVEHESKKKLLVKRDDFVKGSPSNPWPEVFVEFSQQIRQHVGAKTHDLLTPEFSTTSPAEKAAAQVVLMDCFKEYFDFCVASRCGIPEITLEGTVDDWRRLRERALNLAQYKLDWWISALSPILDQFVKAASGKVDQHFWSTIYKMADDSGGPFIYGWILTLFPYNRHGQRNKYLSSWEEYRLFDGMTTDEFTAGIVCTPFNWAYFDKEFPMNFYAGFMTCTQDQTALSLRPEVGWAVVSDTAVQSAKEHRRRHW